MDDGLRVAAGASAAFVRFEKREIEQSIPSRFAQQARRFSAKLAVKARDRALTYGELDALANRIARLILERRGKISEPVALYFGQTSWLVAAILGILKAGKLYLPLDPVLPDARNRDAVLDSGAGLLLTEAAHMAHLAGIVPGDVSIIDISKPSDAGDAGDPGLDLAPDTLAYLFYTSGSTGQAKGIADTHRNVLHNVMRYTNSLRIAADDRLSLIQTAGFSGSVSSLFSALLNGATAYPFSLQDEGATRLGEWASAERLTMFHSVPSIFRLLAAGDRDFPDLRIIRLEGDRAAPADIALFKARFAETCTLVNGLGATECGIVRQYFVTRDTPLPEGSVPIGQAVEDMEVLLLDERGNPVPAGTAGEIVIRSRYLAPGYWNRADLTAAAFSTDPLDPGYRRYRTGDMGRMSADGCLDYLGRHKFQARIRGTWIDTDEIESALHSLGLFSEVVVHVPDEDGDPRLVAYLVAKPGKQLPTENLRRKLWHRLPPAMIPAAFVILDRLPLNSFGKIDRSALPAPSRDRPALATPFVEPSTGVQQRLQQIWQSALSIRPIGIHDNFFDLGGNSFHALLLSLETEQAFGRKLPPDFMFAEPTIAALALILETGVPEVSSPVVEIQKGASQAPFYFLHGDYTGGGFYAMRLARHLGAERPFYALAPLGVDGSPMPESYQAMASQHLRALRHHRPHGPYLLGGTCNGGLVAYEMARRLMAEGERVEALILLGASVSGLRFHLLRWLVAPLRLISASAADKLFGWFRGRLTEFMSIPPKDRPRRIADKLRKQFRRSSKTWQPAAKTPLGEFHAAYQRVDYRYWPGPYDGRITLLWWEGEDESAEEVVRLWRQIARDVELHCLPHGMHDDIANGDVSAAAGHMRRALEQTDQYAVRRS